MNGAIDVATQLGAYLSTEVPWWAWLALVVMLVGGRFAAASN